MTTLASCLLLLAGRAPAATNGWTLLGWNDLGMHCMDGSDYSIFSVLPPFNTFNAQLIYNGKLLTNANGVTLTYEAVADPEGSINTSSKDKLNFWVYSGILYGAAPAPDMGLAGFGMPGAGNVPQMTHFTNGMFDATGVPITPYDDATNKNYYPMMRLVARSNGAAVASVDIVLPVSDEMDCKACHLSGSGPDARPAAGWAWQCGPERDTKINILRLHDQLEAGNSTYTSALASVGFHPAGLYATVFSNAQPVLCAKCHKSNALGTTGEPGVPDLTHAMHTRHAEVIDPITQLKMDSAANRSTCYRCHPGSDTRCLRGAMGKSIAPDGTMAINCQNCHGGMSLVGQNTRQGWFQEPVCQSCHVGGATNSFAQIRFITAFISSNTPRQAIDRTFATSSNAPAAGLSLYRFSKGHGGVSCEACHGSTHAEFPTIHRNDNIISAQVQGHVGTIGECSACHVAVPSTVKGGPHGMHPVGSSWIEGHKSPGESPAQCRTCHGLDYKGTVLSRTFSNRVFSTDFGTKRMWRGFQVGCYNCHNGPNDHENTAPNTPAVVANVVTSTVAGTTVDIVLAASDVNGDALALRVVSQPARGTVALSNSLATYFSEPQYVGTDTFTYAAWDGWTDSNLATVKVAVAQGFCALTLAAAAPTSASAGVSVPFWSVASAGACSNKVSVYWTFGDASGTDRVAQACHVFGQPGTYLWKSVASAGSASVTNDGQIVITSPSNDSDGDGMPDDWEMKIFGNLAAMGDGTDYDHDGFVDLHEYFAGTSPTNDQSFLKCVSESTIGAGGIVIRWASESNRVYLLSKSADLMTGAFLPVASNLPATYPVNAYTDTAADAATYRVELEP